jgi:hypothetical protein
LQCNSRSSQLGHFRSPTSDVLLAQCATSAGSHGRSCQLEWPTASLATGNVRTANNSGVSHAAGCSSGRAGGRWKLMVSSRPAAGRTFHLSVFSGSAVTRTRFASTGGIINSVDMTLSIHSPASIQFMQQDIGTTAVVVQWLLKGYVHRWALTPISVISDIGQSLISELLISD